MGPLTRGSRMWLGIKWTPLPAGRWLIERCSRVMEAGLGCGQLGCSSAPYSVLDDCHVNTTSLSVFWIVKGAERDSASRIFWIGVRGAARGLPVPGDPGISDAMICFPSPPSPSSSKYRSFCRAFLSVPPKTMAGNGERQQEEGRMKQNRAQRRRGGGEIRSG